MRVALFTLAVTATATIALAVVPALRSSQTAPAGSMAHAAARTHRRLFGLRDAVLVPQLAIAIALISVAGLLVRSLLRADQVAPGFDLDHTSYVALNLSMSGYDEVRARDFYGRLVESLEQRGAITTAAVTSRVPLDLYGNQSATVSTDPDESERRTAQIARVGARYFDAMGVSILRGRTFEAADELTSGAPVVMVSAAAARQYWPDADAIGQFVRFADETSPARVVGVAADSKVQTLGEQPQPLVYQPLKQGYAGLIRLVIRTQGSAKSSVVELRRALTDLDPGVAVFESRTMAEHLGVMLYPYRLIAALGSAFGLIAIVIAAIGLYGVLACGVCERLRELAIRLALGAPAVTLLRSAADETLRATVVAVASGGLMAIVAGKLLSDVLFFGISAFDPIALIATTIILTAVVALASVAPLRRALRAEVSSLLRNS
jgi:putative ABC transport system permease protein